MIECAICENKLKKTTLKDSKWEEIKDKYLCRKCAKTIAYMVVAEY